MTDEPQDQQTEENDPESISSILDNNPNIAKKELSSNEEPKRKGPGRPAGSMNKATMETKIAKRHFIDRVNLHTDKLFNAQLSLATGEQVLMVQVTEGEGKNQRRYHEVVTDNDIISQYLDYEEGIGDKENPSDDKHWYYLTTRTANNQAIDSLLNRSFGKAPEKLEVEGGFFKDREMVIKIIKPEEDQEADASTTQEEG